MNKFRLFRFDNFSHHWRFVSIMLVFCLMIFCINLYLKYQEYQAFRFTPYFEGQIVKEFEKTNKNGKKYNVLHIKTHDFTLYTTMYKKLHSNHLRFKILKKNISFLDYLKSRFYAPAYDILELENIELDGFKSFILSQHQNDKMKDFYGALFFAKSISNDLRTDINHYGIAHLLAISGYHLGLIYSVLFFIFSNIYKLFHQKYFPYRSVHFDLGILVFICIGFYFFQIGFVPSFLRSFVMGIFGFYFLCRGIKLVNFIHLFLAFLVCVALFPSLVFSVGFFFSCMGVFYIFLYARHFPYKNFYTIVGFEVWTFFAMILPVLYFFPFFSLQQLFAIVITPLFVIFYPLSILLHLFNFGDLFDVVLLKFLDFKMLSTDIVINSSVFYAYLILSFLSIFNKSLAVFLVSLNVVIFIWFFIKNYIII